MNVFELEGSISLDSDKYTKGIKEAVEDGEELARSLSENAQQMKAMQEQINSLAAELNNAKAEISRLKSEFENAGKAADESAQAVKEVSDSVKEAGETAKSSLGGFGKLLTSDMKEFTVLKKDVDDVTKDIVSKFKNAGSAVSSKFKEIKNTMSDNIRGGAANAIISINSIPDKIKSGVNNVRTSINNIPLAFKTMAETAVEHIKQIPQKLKELPSTVKSAVSTISTTLSPIGEKIKSAFSSGIESAKKKFEELGEKAKEIASKINDTLKNAVSAIAKATTAAVGAASAAIVGFTKSSLDDYASYEQLVGGVDTLFGESSAKVQAYADEAYKTAGLSANAYMETVTSFSASLLQGLGGDTEQAADLANTAIVDMSDNANKMGTDMQSIQNAYQGFAKQNYTMLDNLNEMGAFAA